MKSLTTCSAMAILGALLTGGCSNKLVFATHTSLGLDVSGTAEVPDHVSFSYDREEAAIVPRKTDGEAHSVYGGLDSDISWWHGSIIKQTFATGDAARIATGSPAQAATNSTDSTSTKPLVFVTGTTFGLHLSAGEGQVQPDLLLGYRRGEAAYIPVPDPNQEVRSVYADLLINTKSRPTTNQQDSPALTITTNFPSSSGVRIKQSFATGTAAENLAKSAGVQAKLDAAAGTAIGALRLLKEHSAELDGLIAMEVAMLTPAQLDQGGEALRAAGLTDEANLAKFKQMDPSEKRRILREFTKGMTSEGQVAQKENYLTLLKGIQ